MNQDERVSVQADDGWGLPAARRPKNAKPPGTITWAEHEEAWRAYAKRNPAQSATRIAQRGGFGYAELERLLGHPPKTWQTVWALDDEGRFRVLAETRRG